MDKCCRDGRLCLEWIDSSCIGGRCFADDNLLDQNRLPPSPATPAIKFPALRSLPPAFMLIISIAGVGVGLERRREGLECVHGCR